MDPEKVLTQLRDASELHTSPCGSGIMQWREWPGPQGRNPLLLLHGGFGSWTHWVANIDHLRRYRPVWAVDLPGLGDSGDMPEPLTAEHMASVLLQGINQLLGPQQSFDVAGFSFGALVGAQLALLAGSRCQHLVLCGAAGFGKLHVQVELLHPPGEDVPAAAARSIHHANLRSLMFSSEDYIDDLALYVHGSNLARSRFNSRRLARGDGLVKALPNIRARLTAVWGSRDVTAGGLRGIEQREALIKSAQPGAGFFVLEGVGHWAMYEAPDTFNDLLVHQLND